MKVEQWKIGDVKPYEPEFGLSDQELLLMFDT